MTLSFVDTLPALTLSPIDVHIYMPDEAFSLLINVACCRQKTAQIVKVAKTINILVTCSNQQYFLSSYLGLWSISFQSSYTFHPP